MEEMPEKKPVRRKKTAAQKALQTLGKLPPQALDLEEAVLGALMIDKNAAAEIVDLLHPKHFYKEAHQKVFQAILDLFAEGGNIDILTVMEQARKNGDLELIGGPSYLSQLTIKTSSAAHILSHAHIVMEKAIKRELISVSATIQEDAFEDTRDVFELLDRTQQALFDVAEQHMKKNYETSKTIVQEALEEIMARRGQGALSGLGSGYPAIDRVTSGWQKSDLIILAARPAMGKTALALCLLRNAAVLFDTPSAIFSLEMSKVQLMNRLMSSEAEIEGTKFKEGNLDDNEMQHLATQAGRLSEASIIIDDTPSLSLMELRAKARRMKSQHDIGFILIDYLQLMSADVGRGGNREQEIATISRGLKQLAKELNIPVIALAQLSRAVETRGGDKRPMLSDLRESGSIEQDADQVMFLYRPEYYGLLETEEGTPTANLAELIIAKNRHGSVETVPLRFEGQFTKFKDWHDPNLGPMPPAHAPEAAPSQEPEVLGSKVNEGEDVFGPPSLDEPPF